jgi:hypothetical protein
MREIVVSPIEAEVESPTSMLRGASNSERITDVSRVREAVTALFQHHARGSLKHQSGSTTIVADVFATDAEVLRWRVEGAIGKPPFIAELVGHNSVYSLHLDEGFLRGEFLVTPLPSSVQRLRRRWLRRAEISSPLVASFAAPGAPEIFSGPVRNLSYQGLAFELTQPADFLKPGSRIDQLRVFDTGGKSTVVSAEVRCMVPVLRGGCQYGLQVVAAQDPRRFMEMVDDQLHPGTRVGSRWTQQLWDLYDKCGYFSLSGKEPANFARTKSAFSSMTRQLDRAPHLGCHIVWPEKQSETLASSASVLKTYSRSWITFQLAKIKGESEGVSGREILHRIVRRVYEHIQRDPEVGFVLAYAQVKRSWSAAICYDVPARYIDSGEADIVRTRALEVDTSQAFRLEETGGEISAAGAGELDSLAQRLGRLRSRIYCDALDLMPGRMLLEQNRQAWGGMRFERNRQILIARKHGVAVAAAVLEVAADGAHLFGLLDLVRLYSLAPGGELFYPHLLEAAKAWFRDYGKPQFVCFLEDGQQLPAELVAKMNDMGEADLTILAAHRIPELLEHLYAVTAPRTDPQRA